ncbi:hypothetical protein GCM10009560_41710 [Nonomuraea longicatena]|uniref:Uncharacterized protein n=1 Tax=Nonomuraea longicatena TaxID=83682 RepID=A0ABN1PYN1_9ACTN
MSNSNPPTTCFTAEDPPLAMRCALCGHPPYAHGSAILGAHEYEVPSAELMAEWLRLYRALGLHRRRISEAGTCVTMPEPVDSVWEAAPVDEPFAACEDSSEAAEVIAPHRTTSFLPDGPNPVQDDIRPTEQAAPGSRRRAILRPPYVGRVGVGARRRLSSATPEHVRDASTGWPRSYPGRVYPPNRPEPVGWQQRPPATLRGGER